MMILEKLFRLVTEKNALDMFVSAGAPSNLKVNGTAMPINAEVLSA